MLPDIVMNKLRQSVYFRNLSETSVRQLQNMKSRQLKKNAALFHPGMEVEYVYFILNGSIKFEVPTKNGQESFMEIGHKGYFCGDHEVLSGQPYLSEASAFEDSEILLLPASEFLAMIDNDQGFSRAYTRQLGTNFYFYQMIVAERSTTPVVGRLANQLLNLFIRFGQLEGNRLHLKISHTELSQMLNVSRQSITTQLNEWQKLGIVICEYSELILNDQDALRNLSTLSGMTQGKENILLDR